MKRERIEYRIGNEHNPGNPFGRSHLTIEPDGRMRHELFFGGPAFAWTATVLPEPLEEIWSGLEASGYPECPRIAPIAGATLRLLRVGAGAWIELPLHQGAPGYNQAFAALDQILRVTCDDMVRAVPIPTTPIVRDVARAEPLPPEKPPDPAPPPEPEVQGGVSAGVAFLLAYLPACRVAHERKVAHLAALEDPALDHAKKFGGAALAIEGRFAAEVDARRVALAREHGVDLADVGASLVTRAAIAASKAGATAGELEIAAELAAHVAYLRASAPANPTLRAEAEEHARVAREKAAQLATELEATRRPLGYLHKDAASRMVSQTGETFAELGALAMDLRTFFSAMGSHLDGDPPSSFMVVGAKDVVRSSPAGWVDVEPRVLAPARPELQRILERALGLRREESRRVLDTERPPSFLAAYAGEPPGVLLAATKKRAQIATDVRARAMAAEDAYERLAPKSWLDDERRWFVTDQVPPKTKHEEPLLEAAWTSWVLRRRPSSIDVLTTICADPENAVLAEDYAFEACRFMAEWGWRTPRRVMWMAEPEPRFHEYKGARPFRERADVQRKVVVELEIPAQARAHHAQRELYDEGKLRAKLDLMRAAGWPAALGKNPFEPIVEIWKLGYALSAVTDFGVVLVANAPKLEELLEPLAS